MKVPIFISVLAISLTFVACKTTESPRLAPTPAPTALPTPAPSPVAASPRPPSPTPEASFDPKSITAEEKKEALDDIGSLIQMLNAITQRKDFDKWKTYLTPEFIEKFSSPETLAELSNAPILKRLEIELHSLQDYFLFVVYPSHQNDRVDDIEFIGHNRVRAITVSKKGERLVLWSLEKIDSSWKIGIGR